MARQILSRLEQPQKLLPAHARGRFTSPIPRGDLLIPRTLVQGPDKEKGRNSAPSVFQAISVEKVRYLAVGGG
jgi:hypothetical protein